MNIIVLCGGLSSERDVSFKSGEMVSKALKNNGHNVILLDVFMGYGSKEIDVSDIFSRCDEISMNISDIPSEAPNIEKVKASRADKSDCFFGPNVINMCRLADIVFMALHGSDGENGKVQAAFDLYGIRYTGNGYLSSAIAMNKGITKKFFREYEIPTPGGFSMSRESRNTCSDEISFPCVVKPSCGGSSVGVSIANNMDEFNKALDDAFAWEDEVVIEDYIKGREFSVGVIDCQALPIIEIAPKCGFYDFKNKYSAGSTVETCPAELDDATTSLMQLYAERVSAALGFEVYARMDFLMNDNGKLFCLEANTLPGMTPTSLLPQEAAAVGIDFDHLCENIIRVSMNKYI